MPFTLAHPSILFPLRWINAKYISFTALVIGSMIPDFEYFLWMRPDAYHSHTLHGIFIFDLPATFLCAFLFHLFIRKPFLFHFPFFKDKYLLPEIDFVDYLKKNWLVFTLSALFGICTHLIWDACSHAQGYFVVRNTFLNGEVSIGGAIIKRCYLVWYLSSIVGLLLVLMQGIDFKKILKRKENNSSTASTNRYWGMILFLTALFLIMRIWNGLSWAWFRHFIISTIGAFMYALIIVSWLENRKMKKASV